MKINFLVFYFFFFTLAFSQRGVTGDKTFSSRFPEDKFNEISNASLEIVNEVDHDIIVVIRDQRKKYIRHVYIRNREKYRFEELPITRIYVQFKSKEFYFEDYDFYLSYIYEPTSKDLEFIQNWSAIFTIAFFANENNDKLLLGSILSRPTVKFYLTNVLTN